MNVNVPLTTSLSGASSFDTAAYDGSSFAVGEEFVFTVTTQNSHPNEMGPLSSNYSQAPIAYWSDELNPNDDHARKPAANAELNETIIVPINTTTRYFFGIQGSQMPNGVSSGSATMTLTCRVSVASSSDASLSSLTLNPGILSPAFASGTKTYAVSVLNGVSSLTVTPTTNNSGASVKINGSAAPSGQGFPFNLSVGPNQIDVVVTAGDGVTTETYTLNVTRAAAAPTVTGISPSSGATVGGTSVTITGSDFTGATAVSIGGQAATTYNVMSATQITATTQAHAAGAVDVVVTTPAGSGTLTGGFTYATSTPTVVVSASNASPALGASVTFTATFSNGASPSGTVTVKSGLSTLGTATISGTTATLTTSALGVGSHSITAEYAGDTNNAAATSAGTAVNVGQAAPTVVVSASNASPALGASVTFTATLSNGASPSGTVTFKNGLSTLGTATISGTTATLTTSALGVGSHSITAEYAGDTNNAAATSAAISVSVAAPTFTFSPAAGALPSGRANSPYGQSVTASASGSTMPITYALTTGTLPSGLTIDPANGAILGTPTAAGTFSFTVTATDGAASPNSGAANYTLTISPAATFVFSPAGGSLPEAMSGEEYSQPISAAGGTGSTTYSVTAGSLPAGLTLNVSTGELTGPLSANTEGDYGFTIQARDSTNATASASYTLHVAQRAVTVDDKTVTLTPGSAPNNINLASGATGGPFVSAQIISVTQSNAGSFSIVNGEFAQASGPTPTGWYMKFIPNPAFSGRVSIGFRLTSALGVSNTGTVTYNVAYDPGDVAYEIDTLVYGFVQTRQNLISSMIKVPGLLERRQMARATEAVTTRMTPSAQGITLGFATSLAQLEAARNEGDGIVEDEQLPFNIWIDSTFVAHNREENGNKWGNFAMLSAGADYLLSAKALIGLSFHYDRMTDPTKEDATLTGNGWLAGPNASLEIGKGIFWDTGLLYGGSLNSIDTQFWDGDFDTTRWMFDTSISGQWLLDATTTFTPKLRALYFSETAKDYSVRNSDGDVLTIQGFTQDQLRVSLGAELAREFTLENDSILTPKIGLTGGISDRDSNRAFGQLSTGLSLDMANNWNIDAGLLFNVSADDEKSIGVKVGVGAKF